MRCFQLLTWMPETFDARFPVLVMQFFNESGVPTFGLAPSQNSNVWQPNCYFWTHFEPIFSLRVYVWIQTTIWQLAGLRGRRRKRQLSFTIGWWLFVFYILSVAKTTLRNFRQVRTAFSGKLPKARVVLVVDSYSPQTFPRKYLLNHPSKYY